MQVIHLVGLDPLTNRALSASLLCSIDFSTARATIIPPRSIIDVSLNMYQTVYKMYINCTFLNSRVNIITSFQ